MEASRGESFLSICRAGARAHLHADLLRRVEGHAGHPHRSLQRGDDEAELVLHSGSFRGRRRNPAASMRQPTKNAHHTFVSVRPGSISPRRRTPPAIATRICRGKPATLKSGRTPWHQDPVSDRVVDPKVPYPPIVQRLEPVPRSGHAEELHEEHRTRPCCSLNSLHFALRESRAAFDRTV